MRIDETRAQPSPSARYCLIWGVPPQRGILSDNHPRNQRSSTAIRGH
jgi:hypothetical protein